MTLTRIRMVKYHPSTRSSKDRRKFVSKAVFEYRDENNVEYRKCFELPSGTTENEFNSQTPKTIQQ